MSLLESSSASRRRRPVRGVARTEEARRAERMVVVEKCILILVIMERLTGLLVERKSLDYLLVVLKDRAITKGPRK